MARTELKEMPQVGIIPCPRCINGQILAINNWVCFQCGYELKDKLEESKEYSEEEAQLLQIRQPWKKAEKIICPKCGKEVCLNNQTENKIIKPHKDPATEGLFPRPWCVMSGEVIP